MFQLAKKPVKLTGKLNKYLNHQKHNKMIEFKKDKIYYSFEGLSPRFLKLSHASNFFVILIAINLNGL
jgi:hypothetical protein